MDYLNGLYAGASGGWFGGDDGVTNQRQLTFCPPACTPDPTPNPFATFNSTGPAGNVFLGYNQRLFNISPNVPVIVGAEGFFGFGSSSTTIAGIPGIGGIAPPGVTANDSTTVKFGSNSGVIGKIGTIVPVGGVPVLISFDGGVSWQHVDVTLNCTGLGACGFNGIPAQTLTASKTLTGTVLGGEFKVPMSAVPGLSLIPQSFPIFNRALFGLRYLHGDFGDITQSLGVQSQIQITANQHVTTNSVMGTFSLPLTPAGSARSDIRLKRDIAPLRRLENGLDLYRFRYLWSDTLYVGVMAQEVERLRPDAVTRDADGYMRVNYDALGLKFQTFEEWIANEQ